VNGSPIVTLTVFDSFRDAWRVLIGSVLDSGNDLGEQSTRELWAVAYSVSDSTPDRTLLALCEAPEAWVDRELDERTSLTAANPGDAWRQWPEVFESRLKRGRFHYTYPERMAPQIKQLIALLNTRPSTRRGMLMVWDACRDAGEETEVPCTVSSQFTVRNECLHAAFYTRSNDLARLWPVDVYLYAGFQAWLAMQVGVRTGTFSHFIGSLHIYDRDLEFSRQLLPHL
jgi:thymidylate synthase